MRDRISVEFGSQPFGRLSSADYFGELSARAVQPFANGGQDNRVDLGFRPGLQGDRTLIDPLVGQVQIGESLGHLSKGGDGIVHL